MYVIEEPYIEVYLLASTRDFDRPYTYLRHEQDTMRIGQLVEVPFGRGNSTRQAVIKRGVNTTEWPKLKRISRVVLADPIFRPDQISLAEEMRRRYFCSIGQALKAISPPTVHRVGAKTARACRLIDPAEANDRLAENDFSSLQQIRVVEFLLTCEQALLQEVQQACQVSSSVLNTLKKNKIIEIFRAQVARDEQVYETWSEVPVIRLNQAQEKALARIAEGYSELNKQRLAGQNSRLTEYLLHGVTGSGKTEVYMRAAEQVLADNRGVIILVPEISLTPLMIARLIAHFGERIAILHSRLTPTQRYEQWHKILCGEKKIVVGARSAIFAPLQEIGLIVIDEEQESSYQSETTPRYDALEIARIRALTHQAVLVLGSATPSVETYHRTRTGQACLLSLPQRAKVAPLPQVHLIDLKQQLSEGSRDLFSRPLADAMRRAFARGKQVMIFLNRRGHASYVQCKECGYIEQCNNCEVAMTEHLNLYADRTKQIICHYCGLVKPLPSQCPVCQSADIQSFGLGTQQVEARFKELFQPYRALRMDFDTTIGTRAHEQILRAFAAGEADCLIGTQMIAKGHDFPDVQVVGILAADALLATGSFRAEERAFQLITQAAGRSGRSDEQGEVYIQGYQLNHFAVEAAAAQDYNLFYRREIEIRRLMNYPPFGHIAVIIVQGRNDRQTRAEAEKIQHHLGQAIHQYPELFKQIRLYEPARAPMPRIRGRYRYRLILRGKQRYRLAQLLAYEADRTKPRGIAVSLDLDSERIL